MRLMTVTLMVLFGGLQATPPRNGIIEGRVIRASNEAPVPGARVVLVPPPTPGLASAGTNSPTPPATGAIPQGTTTVQLSNGQFVVGAAPALNGTAAEIAAVADDDGKFTFKD